MPKYVRVEAVTGGTYTTLESVAKARKLKIVQGDAVDRDGRPLGPTPPTETETDKTVVETAPKTAPSKTATKES